MNIRTSQSGNRLTALVVSMMVAVAASVALIGPATAHQNGPTAEGHRNHDRAQMAMGHHSAASGKRVHKAKRAHRVSRSALTAKMRILWAEHMEWTYAVVAAFASGSAGLDATVDRLLANQEDIGNAIKPFYGAAAGDRLTALLKEHITDAVPVLSAARAGDTAALNQAVATWYANAETIGNFLADANPRLNRAAAVDMMRMHITQTVSYAADQLTGDYSRSITKYEEAEHHMRMMSDALVRALAKQFPKRFKR